MALFRSAIWSQRLIPVTMAPEPAEFDERVRQPGEGFRLSASFPIVWRGHEYWRRAIPNLRSAHHGVCTYSAVWIPNSSGGSSVDHYHPLQLRPDLAYEWTNYRFASQLVNAKKGVATGLLDPFDIGQGWFALVFPSLLVVEGPNLPAKDRHRFEHTVDKLGLNDERLLQDRLHWLEQYCAVGAPISFLERHAPFIAAELIRQDLLGSIQAMMSFP